MLTHILCSENERVVGSMKLEISSESSDLYERFVHWITSAISCIIPFLARVPNLTWYSSAMLIPFFSYLYFISVGYLYIETFFNSLQLFFLLLFLA